MIGGIGAAGGAGASALLSALQGSSSASGSASSTDSSSNDTTTTTVFNPDGTITTIVRDAQGNLVSETTTTAPGSDGANADATGTGSAGSLLDMLA